MRDLEDEKRIKAYMEAKMKHIKMYNECMNLADGLDVEKFAELVRQDEREACAKICETESRDSIIMNSQICSSVNIADIHEAYREGRSMGAGLCGQAIRERGRTHDL